MSTPRIGAGLLLCVAIAACRDDASAGRDSAVSLAPPAGTADTGWVARPAQLGAVRAGMTRGQLIGVIGQPSRVGYATHEQCKFTGGSALPPGVRVMTFDSVVVRVDVTEPGVRTAEGLQVGDAEQAVLSRYGRLAAVTPHKYSGPAWHYVTVTPPGDTLHRIVFETDGQLVKSYRIGMRPYVEWVEGCS